MNTKKMITLLGVVAMLLLGGCVATPYYGGSVGYSSGGYYGGSGYYGSRAGYGYGYRPAIPAVRSNLYFGGHRHSGHRHIHHGHRHSHGHRGHHRGGGHGHFGGHRGGGHGHRGHRGRH